jgi:hypothetical protein
MVMFVMSHVCGLRSLLCERVVLFVAPLVFSSSAAGYAVCEGAQILSFKP